MDLTVTLKYPGPFGPASASELAGQSQLEKEGLLWPQQLYLRVQRNPRQSNRSWWHLQARSPRGRPNPSGGSPSLASGRLPPWGSSHFWWLFPIASTVCCTGRQHHGSTAALSHRLRDGVTTPHPQPVCGRQRSGGM